METTIHTQWSDEKIIDLVRSIRNELIKDFLDERFLKDYMATHFRVKDLSNVKIEFIKKDLKELLIAPVNTAHYKPLIEQIKLTDSAALTINNDQLFYKEVEQLFKKYF